MNAWISGAVSFGRPASPPTESSRNAGAIVGTSADVGGRSSKSPTCRPSRGNGKTVKRAPRRTPPPPARRTSTAEHLGKVLVAAARKADEHELRIDVERARERVRRLQCWDDAFRLAQPVERRQRIVVGRGDVLRAAG